jgi:hypothetical protein
MQHIRHLSVLAPAENSRINKLSEPHAPALLESFPSDSAGNRHPSRHLYGLKLLYPLTHQKHLYHERIAITEPNPVPDWQVPDEAKQGHPIPDRDGAQDVTTGPISDRLSN